MTDILKISEFFVQNFQNRLWGSLFFRKLVE